MYKVVWVAGMPRSGSMWTFNVVRELVRRAGFRVLPEKVLTSDQEWGAYANREIAANDDPGTVFVLKMHACLHNVPPDNLVITNIRDIRDALVSYMRFMHVDFEKALDVGKVVIGVADHYLNLPEEKRMALRYDEMTAAPAATIAHIADRLGLRIDEATAEDLAAQFSKTKVRALTEGRDQHYQDLAKQGQTLVGDDLLCRADGVPAAIDWSTGFQSDHVSDYQDGAWRQLLSSEQISAMGRAFDAWLMRNGYAA
ncbi:MAG: sulfotransferase domain-containing protein [Alphaproteobacteria bacterium]|nr:sulfotransferase domain-containing protein [Alphaproteobacteria bacterium]